MKAKGRTRRRKPLKRVLSAAWRRADALRDADLPPIEKLVLVFLLDTDRMAKNIEMYPSKEKLAYETNLSDVTVRKAIKSLCRRGVLIETGETPSVFAGGRPRGRVKKYRFSIEQLPARAPWDATNRRSDVSAVEPRQAISENPQPIPESRQPISEHATAESSGVDRRSDVTAIVQGTLGNGRDRRRAAAPLKARARADAGVLGSLDLSKKAAGAIAGALTAPGAAPRLKQKAG